MITPRVLRLRGRVLELGPRPLLMGIVNATPDSFSDAGDHPTVQARVAAGSAVESRAQPSSSERGVGWKTSWSYL